MLFDLKLAVRSLVKSPRFATIVVLTLAFGIGSTVAIFSMVNAVLLQPLPYSQPQDLALLYTDFPTFAHDGPGRFSFSRAEYLDLKRATRSWQLLAGWSASGANIATAREPARVNVSRVTGEFLQVLGVAPLFGRGITREDDVPGAPLVAVISYGLWQKAFGGERTVLGRDIRLDGRQCTVVGVMPKDFRFSPQQNSDPADVWAPLQIDAATADNDTHNIFVVGRLRAGLTLDQAQEELKALVAQWGRIGSGHHFDPKEHTISSFHLIDEMTRTARPALRMMFGAVCFLLLIACANVAILVLARMESRRREIALRAALGEGTWRLGRQFMSEYLVVGLAGTLLGLLWANVVLRTVDSGGVPGIAPGSRFDIDGRVLVFAIALTVITVLGFGMTSLAAVLKRNPIDAIKSGSTAITSAAGAQRLRKALIAAQLALALVLLTGSGLMLRAFWNLTQVDAGVDSQGVITMTVNLPEVYTGNDVRRFWARLEERLTELPDVQGGTLSSNLPPYFKGSRYLATQIEGFVPVPGGAVPYIPTDEGLHPTINFYQLVAPSYFDTLRIHLLAGRSFDRRDSDQGSRVAIVNQTLAQMFWPDRSAVGRRIRPDGNEDWYTVVGVVADVKADGVEKPAGTQVYLPYAQAPDDKIDHVYEIMMRSAHIAIRTRKEYAATVAEVRRAVGEIDAGLPLTDVRTLNDLISSSQTRPHFLTLALVLFAGAALALSAVGLYGVVSYMVAQRTREFGVRIALGAHHNDVLYLTLKSIVAPLLCAVVLGLAGSWAATRLLTGYLYDVSPTDPAIFIAVVVLLIAIALVSSYIPARRAHQSRSIVRPACRMRRNGSSRRKAGGEMNGTVLTRSPKAGIQL